MSLRYDLHLSAAHISPQTVRTVEKLGFVRDEFANNTRCLASDYHGTFRGPQRLPDDDLWRQACAALRSDPLFIGCLEEESIEPEHQRTLHGTGSAMPAPLPPIHLTDVPAGEHKACDLHIGVNLTTSTPAALAQLEHLEIASFDKPTPEGIRRVYTITCATRDDGERMFTHLAQHLSQVPGLHGKMKLEMTTRYLRHPDDAPTLPLTTPAVVAAWLAAVPAVC